MKKRECLFSDSDNFRAKVEAKELCDLGCTIEEKYGPSRGWKLSLRMSESKKKNSKKVDESDENY